MLCIVCFACNRDGKKTGKGHKSFSLFVLWRKYCPIGLVSNKVLEFCARPRTVFCPILRLCLRAFREGGREGKRSLCLEVQNSPKPPIWGNSTKI